MPQPWAEYLLGFITLLLMLGIWHLARGPGRAFAGPIGSAHPGDLNMRLSVLEERMRAMPQQEDVDRLSDRLGTLEQSFAGTRERVQGIYEAVGRIERFAERVDQHMRDRER